MGVIIVNRLSVGLDELDLDELDKVCLIEALATVAQEQLTEYFEAMVKWLCLEMNVYVGTAVKALAKVTPERLEVFLDTFSGIAMIMETPRYVSSALQRFSNFPQKIYALAAARALLFSRWLLDVERDRRILQVLEASLGQQIPAVNQEFVQGENPYAAGVNVHASDRDKKTENAFELLCSLWNPTEVEIEQYSQDLINYVQVNDPNQALGVLKGGIGNVEKLPGFGSLLQGNAKLAKTRLAHLWHFIHANLALVAPEDVENAKLSIVKALSDSVEPLGVVCDLGKYQHLATSVLQGRLQGVHIDSSIPLPMNGKLVAVNPALLAKIVPQAAVNVAEPAGPARIQYIRNLDEIDTWLTPLFQFWNLSGYPASANDMFQQVFSHMEKLQMGIVPGTGGREIYLDPRDVVFYMIFGKGISPHNPTLDANNGIVIHMQDQNMFKVDDYVAQYQDQERRAFEQEQARQAEQRKLEARRVLIAEQDRAYKASAEADTKKVQARTAAVEPVKAVAATEQAPQLTREELAAARLKVLDDRKQQDIA